MDCFVYKTADLSALSEVAGVPEPVVSDAVENSEAVRRLAKRVCDGGGADVREEFSAAVKCYQIGTAP